MVHGADPGLAVALLHMPAAACACRETRRLSQFKPVIRRFVMADAFLDYRCLISYHEQSCGNLPNHRRAPVATMRSGGARKPSLAWTGTSRPPRMTRLTQASCGRSRSPMAVSSALLPGWTRSRCTPFGLVPQPQPDRPGLDLGGGHRDLQPAGDGWYRAALGHDGEAHRHEDDRVGASRPGRAGVHDRRAQQDRHRALEAGPQGEQPLGWPQPHRPQQQAGQQRPDDEGQQ